MTKQRFEVRINHNFNPPKKRIFIDDKLFDWEADSKSLERARKMGMEYYKAAIMDVQKHFLDSLSDFLGREITPKCFAEATQTGWI